MNLDYPSRQTRTGGDPVIIRLDSEPVPTQRERLRPATRTVVYGRNVIPYWVRPVADLLGVQVSAREGEAVGFFLFGVQYLQLRQWWKNIEICESDSMWIEAHSQYSQIAQAILGEANLFSLGRIAALMPPTTNGNRQDPGNVARMLDRVCQKVGARNRPELRAMVLRALSDRQSRCFKFITPSEKLRHDLYKRRSTGVYKGVDNGSRN